MLTVDELYALHRKRTGAVPVVFRAPGRVNLVGEHTDYAEGFCMPAALNLHTLVAASKRDDGKLVVYTAELAQEFSISLDALGDKGKGHWSDYVAGIARELQKTIISLPGADLTITGDVPIGSGLSSSASIEVATAAALLRLAGATLPGLEIARLAQRAENLYVGAPCGIMDQFVSVHGVAGHALVLDCRALTAQASPIPDSVRLVICNSMVKHSVAGGEYGERRAQVAEAARVMGVPMLRDASLDMLLAARGRMDELTYLRARHIISDSQRVLDLAAALGAGDLIGAGRIMVEAHASYRDDFGASCEECDLLVELAIKVAGCYGSRLTGGGFGGCTVSLVDAQQSEAFAAALTQQYQARTGIVPQCFISEAADGMREVLR